LKKLVQERILVIDGAMGTEIQKYSLTADDYRGTAVVPRQSFVDVFDPYFCATIGERFKDHPTELKGNNDLLSLTRPDLIEKIHRVCPFILV
jgi:5-methyltetrahydrofolate--homocysteine methyltransferase